MIDATMAQKVRGSIGMKVHYYDPVCVPKHIRRAPVEVPWKLGWVARNSRLHQDIPYPPEGCRQNSTSVSCVIGDFFLVVSFSTIIIFSCFLSLSLWRIPALQFPEHLSHYFHLSCLARQEFFLCKVSEVFCLTINFLSFLSTSTYFCLNLQFFPINSSLFWLDWMIALPSAWWYPGTTL